MHQVTFSNAPLFTELDKTGFNYWSRRLITER